MAQNSVGIWVRVQQVWNKDPLVSKAVASIIALGLAAAGVVWKSGYLQQLT